MTTTSIRFTGSVAALLVVALASPPAAAQDKAKEKSLSARAEAHFNEGRRLLDLGEFAKAAAEYQQAYDLVPHPEILYHLGQAHRLQGKKQEAIDFYKKYLAIEPNGRAADKSKKYVALLEKAIADDKAAAEWKKTVEPKQPDEQSDAPAANKAPPPEDDPFLPTFDDNAADGEPAPPGRPLRIAGLAAGGIGLLSLAVGIKLGLDASSLSDELSEPRASWTDEELAKFDDGESKERDAIIFGTLGGSLIVAGAVVYYLGHREAGAERRVSVRPVVGDSQVGLAVGGAF